MTLPRRAFISKMAAGSAAILASHPLFGKVASSLDRKSVLVETAHFGATGGWVLDNQFEPQLGFSYLLAHGMGSPVANATGKVKFPKAGAYHIWVLTKDWCPGKWDAPGQFKVKIGGLPVGQTFGTEAGWAWQSGGVVALDADELTQSIELEDLTGFEARCSAVYFSADPDDVPPIDPDVLPGWRRKKAGLSADIEGQKPYDVVIVGGGITGCAAALAADDQGLKVALIQNRPVLGGNASAEIRVHTLGIHGEKSADFIKQIDTPHYPNGSADSIDSDARRMRNMNAAEHIDIFLNHTMMSVQTEGNRIVSVDTVESANGRRKRFTAPQFIDCTGDGWVGYHAGANFDYGRESKNKYGEEWAQHGELWAPEKPDDRVMGSSVLWYTKEMDQRVEFPDVPWAKPVAKDHISTQGEWQWEYSADGVHQIHDAEQIRDHMFRAIYGTYANTIRHRQHANLALDWVAFNAGKRESRRLRGAHIFTGAEARDSIQFPDTVVTEKRSIDVHYQEVLLGRPEDFLSEALFQKPKDGFYYIPYRSLYSVDVANLQMAGRCFSCSHIGLGGPRVMNTCGQMGVATGFAAAICKKHTVDPATVSSDHISKLRQLCGYPA